MDVIEKNNIFEAEMSGLTSEGSGVCRIDGRAVFVKRALPGERWRIRILRASRSAIWALGEELLSPASADRVEPACPLFGRCGGCDCMHMSYESELGAKLDRVNDAFRRIGGLGLRASGIVPSEKICGYRNKAIYAVGEASGGPFAGFYRSGSHDIIPVEKCLLQNDVSGQCVEAVLRWMGAHGIAAYDGRTGKGRIRHVFVRSSRVGSAVCCVVSSGGLGSATAALADDLRAACPKLTGIVLNINKNTGNTVLCGDFHTLWGSPELADTLCGFEFRVSPQAFYQINPPQAEKLYEIAAGLAAPEKAGCILELYSGAGTISMCLAARAERVIGAEIVPEAVENASANAARNGVTNIEFICADAGKAAKELAARSLRPDAVVVDPPRRGMDAEAIAAVASMSPSRIVYVSCDPATLARDLARFEDLGYHAEYAEAVDMFPRTCHVETVVLLTGGNYVGLSMMCYTIGESE